MTSSTRELPSPDLFTLAEAPIGARIAAIEDEATLRDSGGPVPPRALQIAELVLAEAIRLIRLGTRSELADAADELAQALIGPNLPRLEELQPDAHLILRAASIALGAASAPSSSGGELTVLRSWAGKATDVVAAVSHERDEALPRAELRRRLGDVAESYLSHLLTDLEAAGLVLRSREGREVTVHLGPTGREEHVRRMLPRKRLSDFWAWGREEAAVPSVPNVIYSTISRHRGGVSHYWMQYEPGPELGLLRDYEKTILKSNDPPLTSGGGRLDAGTIQEFRGSFVLDMSDPVHELSE